MSAEYLGQRVRILRGPITAFREYIFRDVIPSFGNIDERAEAVGNEYFDRIGRMPASDDSIDMADVAEAAQEESYNWWEMMTSLRQSMLNLLAAGLFHLVEQQLAALSRDGVFRGYELSDTSLFAIVKWYQNHFGIRLKKLPSWRQMNELRRVANTVKHGYCESAEQLRQLRPELFVDPTHVAIYASQGISLKEEMQRQMPLAAPLSGEDFFVTEEILLEYAESAELFFEELATALEQKA